MQEFDRIVVGQSPKRPIHGFEQPSGIRVPAPPEIVCEFLQTNQTAGQGPRRSGNRLCFAHSPSFFKQAANSEQLVAKIPTPLFAIRCRLLAIISFITHGR